MDTERESRGGGLTGLLVGVLGVGVLLLLVGLLVVKPVSDAATERAGYLAQAASAQAAAQQAAERERTERERQAQETARQNWARTLDVLSVLAVVTVPVCAGIIILGGLVFVTERRAERREHVQVLLMATERERLRMERERLRLQQRAAMRQLAAGRALVVTTDSKEWLP